MTINYAEVDPATPIDPGRGYILNDTFDTGTIWVRTNSGGHVWEMQPNGWWPDAGTYTDQTPIVSNTIQPFVTQAGDQRSVRTSHALPKTFALELDIAINRTLADTGQLSIVDMLINMTDDTGDATYEYIRIFGSPPSGSNSLIFYYESYSPDDYLDGELEGIPITANMNVTLRIEVGADSLEFFIDGVSYGTVARLARPAGGSIWFFGTYNNTYPDCVWRRVTIYQEPLELQSTVTGTSTLGLVRDVLMVLNSEGEVQSTLTLTRNRILSLLSEAEASSSLNMVGILGLTLESSLNAGSLAMLQVGDLPDFQGGVVWVVNMDSGASSQYEQFGFNSFFTRNGVDYGVAADGIYKLEGESDNGREIQAVAVLPRTDMGDPRIKHVPHFYAGISSTGRMILKVEADGNTYYYDARGSSEVLKNQRFDIGRGLEGNYWQLTLLNRDGCDFELDSIEWTPAVRQRRIGS
jgi:hypothetical protein